MRNRLEAIEQINDHKAQKLSSKAVSAPNCDVEMWSPTKL